MIDSGTLLDEGMVYFDARLSRRYPTVEVRVADVCMVAEDAVLLAALVRGLVETAAREWRAGEPVPPVRLELLRLATWRASRSGLTADLVHPVTGRPAPAEAVVRALLDHVGPALSELGDRDAVAELAEGPLHRGTGADLQRRAHKETGDLAGVVRDAVSRTLGE
jgi:carboxylate-amine ligase